MHCKDVSIREVSIELNEHNIRELMKGGKAYVRTEFLILKNGRDMAVIELIKDRSGDLFKDIKDIHVISYPNDTVFLEDPSLDVLNIPALAKIQSDNPGKTVAVKGMFSHISFISGIETVSLRVIDNIPPAPSKLGVLVDKALDTGFIDVPIIVEKQDIDLADKVAEVRTEGVMFPCRVSGLTADMPVYFLDEAPGLEHEVTLIGCNLSERIFRAVYGTDTKFINVCPLDNIVDDDVRTIVKCCKVKSGHIIEGNIAKVPWGATIPEVVGALNALFSRSE